MKNKYYAIKIGKVPGIYKTWDEAKNMIDNFPGAVYQAFPNLELAQTWLNSGNIKQIWPSTGLVCDGGSKGNPGPLIACVVNLRTKETLLFEKLKFQGTNNIAELVALGKACVLAKRNDIIYTDSEVVIHWSNGQGTPTVPQSWINKIQLLIKSKNLKIKKWEKNLWGENPADCK